MIAIDTNVVVRVIALNDIEQSPRAKDLIDSTDVFVSLTVILETGWVLASIYRYPTDRIVAALSAFLGLPNVSVDEAGLVHQAFQWVQDGLDFADALHLAQARQFDAFATFDRRLAANGKHLSETTIQLV